MLPPKDAGRTRAEFTVLGSRDAHHSAKRTQRHDCRRERPADRAFELPVKEKRLGETLLQKAEAGDDARPSPALVRHLENVDLQDVARLGAVHKNGAGERVDSPAIDGQIFSDCHSGANLRAAGVETFEMHCVAGSDDEARFQMRGSSGSEWDRRRESGLASDL